jgi:hypothetical protein
MANQGRALAISVVVAVLALVLLPASATAQFPLGSFYAVIIAIAALLAGLISQRRRLRRPPFIRALVAFYVIATLATLFSGSANPFSLLIPVVALSAYWAAFSASRRERSTITAVIIGVALFETALGAGEVLLGTGVLIGQTFLLTPDNPFFSGLPRAQGTLAHPLVLSFVQIAGLGLVCAGRSRAFLRFLAAVALVAGTALTGSASGFIVAMLVALLWVLNRPSPVARGFAVIVVAIAALLVTAQGFTATIIEQELDARNAGHRLNSVAAIPNLLFGRDVGAALFGSGYSNVTELYRSGIFLNDGFYAVDNQFVSFLVQGGIVGVGFVLTALVGITVVIARYGRRFLPGWIGLILMGASFDSMSWYASAALFLIYAALASPAKPESSLRRFIQHTQRRYEPAGLR